MVHRQLGLICRAASPALGNRLPQFGSDVGCHGGQQAQKRANALEICRGSPHGVVRIAQRVRQLHQLADAVVKRMRLAKAVCHVIDGRMHSYAELLLVCGAFLDCCGARGAGSSINDKGPHTLQPAANPLDGLGVPLEHKVRRRLEEHEDARGVRAVRRDDRHRVDAIVLRLGHLRLRDRDWVARGDLDSLAVPLVHLIWAQVAAARVLEGPPLHHSLSQELCEGLLDGVDANVPQKIANEACVEQMQDCMLDAANVEVDRHPFCVFRAAECALIGRIQIAQVVPRRVHKRVHRVRLAPRRTAALGTGARRPFLGHFLRSGQHVGTRRPSGPNQKLQFASMEADPIEKQGSLPSGRMTGSSASGTGTAPHAPQCTMGMGVPQCR
eukprot:m.98905 g.98905  ORF g.98905 m.98905 type:complete len:384 (+) comp8706_c0_seq1:1161-2312(+)